MACAINAAAETDTITFTATQGDVVLVRVGTTAGSLNPLVKLFGSGGTKLCEAGTSYYTGAEITRCLIPQSGTQSIAVSDFTGSRIGSYNLYLQRFVNPAGALPIVVGTTTTASLTTAAMATSFTFTANANDILLLRAASTAGSLRPLIRLFGSDGLLLCSDGTSYNAGAEITRCALPQTGVYTILVADYTGANSGSYSLYVQRPTNPIGTLAAVMGETQAAVIQTSAEADSYSFSATAGESVLLRVGATSGSVYPLVRVLDRNGVVVCSGGTSYSRGIEISRCLLPQTDTYLVLVNDYSGTATGNYNLYVQRLLTPVGASALVPGSTIAGSIQAAAALHTYTFEATANDVMLMRAAMVDGTMMPFLAVYDTGGVRICTGGTSYSRGTEILRCALPSTGRYTLLVSDYEATHTGTYKLYAQRLTNSVGAISIGNGDLVSNTVQSPAEADTYVWAAGEQDTLNIRMAMTSGSLMPTVRVFDPAGTLVCQAGTSYSPTADISGCLVPRAGLYTILAGDYSGTATGAYRLSLNCTKLPCGGAVTTTVSPGMSQISLGELTISFPVNAITEPMSATLALWNSPGGVDAGVQVVKSFTFQLRRTNGQYIDRASLPLTFAYNYARAGTTAPTTPRLALWNKATERWEVMPNQVNDGTQQITAESTQITNVGFLVSMSSSAGQKVFLPFAVR